MIRLILILIIVGLLVLAVNKLLDLRKSELPQIQPVKTTKCAHCSVYIEKNLAIQQGEEFFCCHEHLNANEQNSK